MTGPSRAEIEAIRKLLLKHKRVLEWGSAFYQNIPGAGWAIIESASSPRKIMRPKPVLMLYLAMPDYHNIGRQAIGEFDLIIVNGKVRGKCLTAARNLLAPGGVVVVRLGLRSRYEAARKLYSHHEMLVPRSKGYGGLLLLSKPLPQKIFVVGLTGTAKHSVNMALKLMGYSYKHYPEPARVIEDAERFDVLSDTPVIQFIEILDRLYPTAKFILTTREMQAWLVSCKLHWKNRKQMSGRQIWNRRSVYGMHTFNKVLFARIYKRHSARVRAYFKNRPGKLLVLNVCGGQGYERLCPFLGVPMVKGPFPYGSRSKRNRVHK